MDIFAKLINMPSGLKGYSCKNPDDSYTILINANLSNEMQLQTYMHELEHIVNGDFDSELSADQLERIRHAV